MVELSNERCYDALNSVVSILDQSKTYYWLDQGTLLGFVRDNEFIDWDWDIDLSALFSSEAELNNLKREFEHAGYDVRYITKSQAFRIEPKIKYYGWRHVDIHFHRKIGDEYETFFYEFKQGSKLDRIMLNVLSRLDRLERRLGKVQPSRKQVVNYNLPPLEEEPTFINRLLSRVVYRVKDAIYSCRVKFFLRTISVRTPVSWFEDREILSIESNGFFTPKDPNGYLAFKYGSKWRIPDRDYDWHEDGAVFGASVSL